MILFLDNPSNYGRVPDMHPFSAGVISMDNPEYILNEQQQRSNNNNNGNRGNYHTLGIPILPAGQSNNNSSPGSSQGPSSIHSAPGAANTNGLPMPQPPPVFLAAPPPGRNAGLNGAVMKVPRTPGAASHPRSSSAEESDEHDYYNDVDRIKRRELQPLHPNSRGGVMRLQPPPQQQQPPPPPPTTMPHLPGLQPISKHETTV